MAYDTWARELEIAVVFEAALAVARRDEEHTIAILAFQSDSGVDGASFARSWIRAYGCDEPQVVVVAGVEVTALHTHQDCRATYLLVFRDQLVVVEDASETDRPDLGPVDVEPIIRAIMEQAE